MIYKVLHRELKIAKAVPYRRVSSSWSTSATRRATLVKNHVISHEKWKEDGTVFMTNGHTHGHLLERWNLLNNHSGLINEA